MKNLQFILFAALLLCANNSFGQCAATDVTDPVIVCPDDVAGLTCPDDLPAGATTVAEFNAIDGTSSATDNCGIELISFIDDLDPSTFSFCTADAPFVVTRTYMITDTAGLTATCDQLFTFDSDVNAPVITPPSVIGIGLGLLCEDDFDPLVLEGVYSEGLPSVVDDCSMVTEAEIAAHPDVIDGYDAGEIITINGISISYSEDTIIHPGVLCSSPNQRKFRIRRTWTASDACGNSDDVRQNINVGDGMTPPVVGVNAMDLALVTNAACEVPLDATMIEDGSTDNCGDTSPDPSTYDVSASASIRVLGSPDTFATSIILDQTDFDFSVSCPFSIEIELRVTDECGNTATSTKVITVEDDTDPIIESCPSDTLLYGCDETVIEAPLLLFSATSTTITEMEFGLAGGAASDSCGILSITYRDSIDVATAGCPNPISILRTFTVLDSCNNAAQCIQTIEVSDTLAPSVICPLDSIAVTSADGTGNCTTALQGLGVTAIDSCDSNLTISYTLTGATTGAGMDDASGTIFELGVTTVQYVVEDCAGNVDSCSFLVEVLDDEAPMLDCPADFTVDTDDGVCEAVVNFTITATDNCDSFDRANLTLLNGIDSSGVFPLGDTEVEFEYMDAAGNADTCTFMVTVEDNEAPVIVCNPSLVVQLNPLQCDTILLFDPPVVSDNCMNLTVTRLDTISLDSGSVFNIGSYTLVYELSDGSDNADTCSFQIDVLEHEASTIVNLAELNLSIDENCFGNITPEMVLLGGDYGCLDSCIVTVLDEDGNEIPNQFDGSDIGKSYTYRVSCNGLFSEGIVNIEDKFPPQIMCVNDTITCGELIVFPAPIVTENCTDFTLVMVNETFESVDCSDPELQQIITREWIATDAAGNQSNTCMQTLSISKFDIGTVMPPAAVAIPLECGIEYPTDEEGGPDPIVYGSPRLGGQNLWPSQFLVCNLMVNYSDQTIPTAQNEISIVRTWTATTWYCGQDSTRQFVQVFTIADNAGPELTCPADMSFSSSGINCTADVILPEIAITDLCGEVIDVDVQYEGGFIENSNGGAASLPMGSSVVTYIASDDNGNVNSCSYNVFVADNEQPITVCEQFTTINLTNGGTAVATAEMFDDGSFDACGPITLEIRRMTPSCDSDDAVYGESVTFCCEDIGVEQMVVLRATDEQGNFNECMVSATIDDKIPPILVQGLPDITLSCEFPFNENDTDQFGSIVMDEDSINPILLTAELVQFSGPATDGLVLGNCIELIADEFTFSNFSTCGLGSATRILTFTNAQGITVTDFQNITFVNPSPFTINDIDFPDDISFNNVCDLSLVLPANLPAGFNIPTYVEDGCDQIGYDFEDSVTDFSDGSMSCYQIIRTWTVADWCQNSGGVFATFEGQQVITVTNSIAPEITGDCSNREQCSFDIACGPMYIELTNSGSDDCTQDTFLNWSYMIDLDSDGSVDIVGNTSDASGTYAVGLHTINWLLTDGCGNEDACSYTFEIKNCKTATPICLDNLTAEIIGTDTDGDTVPDTEEVTILASYFDGGSYHVCGTDILLSFSPDVNDTTRTYGCDDIGEQPIELWVTDVNGNQDFCTTTVDIQNNTDLGLCPIMLTVDVVGDLYTEMGEMIAKADVELEGGNLMDQTEEDGHYDFLDMPTGGNYVINPDKDIDHINGVSTLDIILIQKHILGLEILDSPFKLIAADVNHSESITGQDIIQVRKLILGQNADFPDNTSWRFIDEDHIFLDQNNPWITEIPESYQINNLNGDMVANFTGVKIGDVNNSATPNNLVGEQIDTRSDKYLSLATTATRMSVGQTQWVSIYADNFDQMTGFQMGMKISEKANILDIRSGALELHESNYRINNDKKEFSMIWHNADPMTIASDQVLFEVLVEANTGLSNIGIWTIDDKVLRNEAYDEALQISLIEINSRNAHAPIISDDVSIEIAQNEPNPWMNTTVIKVNSSISELATLRIMDMTGKVILTKQVNIEKGQNMIQLNKDEISSIGVLYYEIEIADTKMMKKMVLLK